MGAAKVTISIVNKDGRMVEDYIHIDDDLHSVTSMANDHRQDIAMHMVARLFVTLYTALFPIEKEEVKNVN